MPEGRRDRCRRAGLIHAADGQPGASRGRRATGTAWTGYRGGWRGAPDSEFG